MLNKKLTATMMFALMASGLLCQNAFSQGLEPESVLKRFDTNKDGKLTEDEIPEQSDRLKQMMQDADKDNDDTVTKQELTEFLSSAGGQGGRQQSGGQRSSGMQRGQGGRSGQRGGGFGRGRQGRGGGGMSPEAVLNRFDTNEDGKLTADEIPEQAARLMQMMKDADKDQDSTVTKQELSEYFSSSSGRGGRQPMRGDGGRSRGSGGLSNKLLKTGETIPNLTAYSADGAEVNLRDLKGNYSVLVLGCLT